MKNLLAILGTITIAGSGVAGIVGNAPAPAKTEINSLQTSNLENLSRNKRDYPQHPCIDEAAKGGISGGVGGAVTGALAGGLAGATAGPAGILAGVIIGAMTGTTTGGLGGFAGGAAICEIK